ncbi:MULTISPECIES: LemA family protein [Ramlibacter]|jgi:LemA protein|uniref:LemA family protein n=1 Tax=Ramlibacter pinisoli TaxID=2682844 RepID=A0A6N8ITX4_9BURK|nr:MULTISPECIES: LemA family protein [Ramlibacter]MBA2965417.1 LemA family protein [Ramlibacter sp. CGMCC 1.13660]MVQ30381.1 LemA family protein [Ramlibacter pinisoli]
MTSSLAPWIAAAVLLFWTVGAYNRLVRLRGEANAAFAVLDAELTRQVQLVDELLPAGQEPPASLFMGEGPSFWGGLQASAAQLAASLAAARQKPLEPGRIAALDAAQAVFADAWERAERDDAHDLAGPRLPDALIAARTHVTLQCIAAADRFSRAVAHYNAAIRQFPALLLAWLFGFRPGLGIAPLPPPKGPAV